MAFSPNGKILASISGDSTVRLWDIESQTSIGRPLIGNSGTVSNLAFSPDGNILAMGSGFDVLLWDVETHELVGQPLTGHAFFVDQLAFSPDGRTLASSASLDSNILLWDVKTRQSAYQPLSGNIGEITSLTFSPDGKTLASGGCAETSDDYCTKGGMILWNLDPVAWVEESCQRAGRNLTEDEWNQYMPGEEYHKTCDHFPNDPSYYLAIAKIFLSNPQDSHPVETALDKVEIEMRKDALLADPTKESFRIVAEEIESQLSDDFQVHKLEWSRLNLIEQATALGVEFHDANFFNGLCWTGGLSGYANQVLRYCQEAVRLEPDNAHFRDSRGLIRAQVGDFVGAIADFQFYIDAGFDRDQLRRWWINDLKAEINPFTTEVLSQLTVE
jgi:hypothetical protein